MVSDYVHSLLYRIRLTNTSVFLGTEFCFGFVMLLCYCLLFWGVGGQGLTVVASAGLEFESPEIKGVCLSSALRVEGSMKPGKNSQLSVPSSNKLCEWQLSSWNF